MPQIKGIDVSSWNGDIDWKKVKSDGIEFAFIRVGTATNLDKKFIKNIQGAANNAIKCGVYHYSYAQTAESAIAEAKFVLNAVKPYKLAYPIMYDIEDKVHHELTTAQRTDLVEAFCGVIMSSGYNTGVYTSLSWFNTMLDLKRLQKYDKWVAQWAEKCTFKSAYTIWQNSNKGKISGINGDVDLNLGYKDYAAGVPSKPVAKPPVSVQPEGIKKYDAGTKLSLQSVNLYATSLSNEKAAEITGEYWVYDGQILNGRIRITNSESRVNKVTAAQNVTGFIRISDIK